MSASHFECLRRNDLHDAFPGGCVFRGNDFRGEFARDSHGSFVNRGDFSRIWNSSRCSSGRGFGFAELFSCAAGAERVQSDTGIAVLVTI